MATHAPTRDARSGRARNALLWTAQILLAALFAFAGAAKLLMPAAALAARSGLPIGLLRFVAVAELLGAAGLVFPGAFRVKRWLTPLAAVGLISIMIGAVALSALEMGAAAAVFLGVVGVVLALVVGGRRAWAVPRNRAGRPAERGVELAA